MNESAIRSLSASKMLCYCTQLRGEVLQETNDDDVTSASLARKVYYYNFIGKCGILAKNQRVRSCRFDEEEFLENEWQ